MTSGLNSQYISTVDLEEYFVSDINAEALAAGKLWFFVDTNRTQAKRVYELLQGSGNPPDYTYTPLPNPITLSNSGTPMDANGNNIAIYYYPFDIYGNVELYYVECYDADGNLQFTREAWPFPYAGTGGGGGGGGGGSVGFSNQLTNPQFAEILFSSSIPLVITVSGSGVTSVDIAPGWTINITHTGSGTVTLTQTPVTGSSAYPYNPPYVLTIVSSGSITQLTITQTLSHNPDWAAPQITGVMGYLSGSILLGSGTGVSLQYAPSAGNTTQTILTATNTTGAFVQETGTIQLEAANNPQTGAVGYDTIIINLSNAVGTSVISNVQIIPLTTNTDGVQYDQTPVNRQFDQMFNYYNPRLQAKPIPSYLIGWDFALNPAQLGDTLAAQSIGANKSYYPGWDQTILYQATDSGIATSRGVNGELVLTASATGQMAVIQYLDGFAVNELLNGRLSVNIAAKTSKLSGYSATVSLWYTDGTALPDVSAGNNDSIVMGLTASGYPATFNQPTGGTWSPVPRSGLGNTTGATGGSDAQFIIRPNSTTNFNDYGFSGWDMEGIAATGTATFFAIVVGTASITSADTISFGSISLVPGDIPTRPAPKSRDEVQSQCRYYYQKSFPGSVIPTTNAGLQTGEYYFNSNNSINGGTYAYMTIEFTPPIRTADAIFTFYNPVAANNEITNLTAVGDCVGSYAYNITVDAWVPSCASQFGTISQTLSCHWSADARLGIV